MVHSWLSYPLGIPLFLFNYSVYDHQIHKMWNHLLSPLTFPSPFSLLLPFFSYFLRLSSSFSSFSSSPPFWYRMLRITSPPFTMKIHVLLTCQTIFSSIGLQMLVNQRVSMLDDFLGGFCMSFWQFFWWVLLHTHGERKRERRSGTLCKNSLKKNNNKKIDLFFNCVYLCA